MVLKLKKNVFPNTPKNLVQMILHTLQKTKNPKSKDKALIRGGALNERQQYGKWSLSLEFK